MSTLLKNIEEQARALSAEDRARLAESMLESLHTSITEIEAVWAEEIEERVRPIALRPSVLGVSYNSAFKPIVFPVLLSVS